MPEDAETEEEANEAIDHGWRLGAELNRKEAVEIIWAADHFLRALWEQISTDYETLERNWVLPRAPWVAKGPLLEHTCVARHWGCANGASG
jgi:hypothetical protein